MAHRCTRVVPRRALVRHDHGAERPGRDQREQLALAGDVVVHGHRIDAQLRAEPAHRQAGETVASHESTRRVDDHLDRQGLRSGRA